MRRAAPREQPINRRGFAADHYMGSTLRKNNLTVLRTTTPAAASLDAIVTCELSTFYA